MPGAKIGRGAVIRRAILSENCVIQPGAFVGEETGNIVVIGNGAVVKSGEKISAGIQYK